MRAGRKLSRKLKRRIQDWESIRETSMYGPDIKMVNGDAYRKPGSQKK